MKLPRGFGKNYFSLSAITATVNQVSLAQECSRVQSFHTCYALCEQEEEELEEFEELAICQIGQLSSKACHCNCFFKSLTLKILKLFTSAKNYVDYHFSLNTSISPPKSI